MNKSANKSTGKAITSKLTTPASASRVQSAVAVANGGVVPKGSEAGRMQQAAVRNFGKSGQK